MRILVTGGAGFIGHHIVEWLLERTDWEVVTLDRLDVSGNLNRLTDLPCWEAEQGRVRFVWHDLKAAINPTIARALGPAEYILHMAASSHVDRSIEDPMSFVLDNVVGTCNLLNYVREVGCEKAIYFSTDEVFGPAPPGVAYAEWDRYHSGNPYAATKAGAEELALAFQNTYGLPVLVTHTMNVFGERQHPEKFLPLVINRVLDGEKVSIHANKDCTQAGSRFYIHARSVADALEFLWREGQPGDKYNVVGEVEVDNLQLAQAIAEIVGKPLRYELVDFHGSRPGHDLRYALDGSKLAKLGWRPRANFEQSLRRTVAWYLDNPAWLGR